MHFLTNTGSKVGTHGYLRRIYFKNSSFQDLKSYGNTMSVYTGRVIGTLQYGYAAFL